MTKRRTSGDKDAGTSFAYPGANVPDRGRSRGRDTPLFGWRRWGYVAAVVLVIVVIVLLIALERSS